MKPKVFIRVNAEKNKGLGHWVRCTALADMLKTKFDCIFLLKTENKAIVQQTNDLGFACHSIPPSLSLMEEPDYLAQHYLTGKEILVLDSYDFTTEYQRAVKSKVGKLVSIDDIHQTYFVSDVLLNHTGGIQPSDYQCAPETKLCLGLDYLLLRPAFLQNISKPQTVQNDFDRVLICMGGEDPQNDTLKVLSQCEQIPKIKQCEVIIGAGYRYKAELEAFCAQSSLSISIASQLSAEAFFQKMNQCPSAICSASTTALEYLSVSGNLFLYQTADNQKHLYDFLLSQKLAFPFTQMQDIPPADLKKARALQQTTVDNKSPERILAIFSALQQLIGLTFRSAKLNDVFQYFTWVNDPDTREQSFHSQPIDFEEHKNWFERQLNNPNSLLVVMESQGQYIGQIRFNLVGDTAILSYSIDKNERGKGFAKPLIAGGIDFLQKKVPAISIIEGFVKVNNLPSVKTFQRLGFIEQQIEDPVRKIKYIHQLNKATL